LAWRRRRLAIAALYGEVLPLIRNEEVRGSIPSTTATTGKVETPDEAWDGRSPSPLARRNKALLQ